MREIIIVGGGIAGLTAGAYLARDGYKVRILEKNSHCGGLVSSFSREGFVFDTGPRAFGNSGIVEPMLKDLGVDINLVNSRVTTGIKDFLINYNSFKDTQKYIESLKELFPDNIGDINRIYKKIKSYSRLVRILNKIPNPYLISILKNPGYLFLKFIPWLPSFLYVLIKTSLLNKSIENLLDSITNNPELKDMVSQNFFRGTPAYFALGYFQSFLDYKYPLNGTKELPDSLLNYYLEHGGDIEYNSKVTGIDIKNKIVSCDSKEFFYTKLLWASDLKTMYSCIKLESLGTRNRLKIQKKVNLYNNLRGGESVFSLFLAIDISPDYFKSISNGHFIYTPETRGLGDCHRSKLDKIIENFDSNIKTELYSWLDEYCKYNSYEISIPCLRNPEFAPKGKTGLCISLLFSGELFRLVESQGWYQEFKLKTQEHIIKTLGNSIYRGFEDKIIFKISSSPLTLLNMFSNHNGAITGWSLDDKIPVPKKLSSIAFSPYTGLRNIYKAGQWSYSPSGVPISILTAKIAVSKLKKP